MGYQAEKLANTMRRVDELVAERARLSAQNKALRKALAGAGLPLEVLAAQIGEKPYAEMTTEFQYKIVAAAHRVRAALAASSAPTKPDSQDEPVRTRPVSAPHGSPVTEGGEEGGRPSGVLSSEPGRVVSETDTRRFRNGDAKAYEGWTPHVPSETGTRTEEYERALFFCLEAAGADLDGNGIEWFVRSGTLAGRAMNAVAELRDDYAAPSELDTLREALRRAYEALLQADHDRSVTRAHINAKGILGEALRAASPGPEGETP